MVGSDFSMVRISSFDDCDCDGKAVDTILSNSKSCKWFKLVSCWALQEDSVDEGRRTFNVGASHKNVDPPNSMASCILRVD